MNYVHSVNASVVLYNLVKTAKSNNLRVYEYLEYLLEELLKRVDDNKCDFLKDLLPLSEVVQENATAKKSLINCKVQIYEIADKMTDSSIIWYSCLINYIL